MLSTIHISQEMKLSDNDQWQHRFNIPSQTSNRLYTIGQHKSGRYWGCSCPGWKRHRHCKHLNAMGLPGNQQPYEVNLIND